MPVISSGGRGRLGEDGAVELRARFVAIIKPKDDTSMWKVPRREKREAHSLCSAEEWPYRWGEALLQALYQDS